MSHLKVHWTRRTLDADGTSTPWKSWGIVPDDSIVLLAIQNSAVVRLTFSDGSAEEWRVEGIDDISEPGPYDTRY